MGAQHGHHDALSVGGLGSPQQLSTPAYMYELDEIRLCLERSVCRTWWLTATLELTGRPALLVQGGAPGSADAGPRSASARSAKDTAIFAVNFLQRKLGILTLQLLPHFILEPQHRHTLSELASQCARIAQRLASQRWMVQRQLGAPCLIGSSKAMLTLDRSIEASCSDNRPILLLGTTGNEALQTALAIHLGSKAADHAFVKVDCEKTLESPKRWLARARGGTLFLCGVDGGTEADQEHLWRQLKQALGQAAPAVEPAAGVPAIEQDRGGCRLMIAQKSRKRPAGEGMRDWIYINLPSLSQRPDDLPLLTRAVLDYHGHDADDRATDALHHWCANYHWPGNASQLEWAVARLAVLTPNMRIGASDINQHAPRMLREGPLRPADDDDATDASADTPAADVSAPVGAAFLPGSAHWVRCVFEQDASVLARLPAGLNRALQYVGRRYHEPMTAEQLAQQCHVSASHLRFLFRDHLGISFKLLLQQLRIAHAKRLLLELPPRRVADVALSVGFNDFSYFHKCFREITGQTPGDCRRKHSLAIGTHFHDA